MRNFLNVDKSTFVIKTLDDRRFFLVETSVFVIDAIQVPANDEKRNI